MYKIGDLLDNRYLITGELGQGGMAYVFKAKDQHLERDVALKVLRPHLTETDQERFRREIKTLARLNHPGIVTIFDLGREENIYFVMELVESGLITDLGPLEPEPEPFHRLIQAAITVAETLSYVHKLNIVHRDLTPRNILLTSQNQPKIMDFGLVQLIETKRQLTRTGLTLGTPHYMAPEQAKGKATGTHTDLYAFGAVLYRAVTGIAPFDADNDQAVLYQHVYDEPTPANSINPYISSALSGLIADLLAKEPEQRPGSAKVIADRLKALLNHGLKHATYQRLAGPSQQAYYPHGPINPGHLGLEWQANVPEGPQWPATLIAHDGFLFLGLRSEEIHVLRLSDGGFQTNFKTPDEVNTAPLYLNKHLVITSRDGSLSVLSWPEGHTLWTKQISASGITPIMNKILVSTRNNNLQCYELTGDLVWTYETESPVLTPPLVHQLHCYVITQDTWVHCIDPKTGKGKFKFKLGTTTSFPSAKDGILFLPERAGALHAFDVEEKEVIWSYDLAGQLWASPVCWHTFVYTASWDNIVRCISMRTGSDIWSKEISAHVTATPIITAGVLYIVTETGQLIALDALTGKTLYEERVSLSPIQASPLAVDNKIIIAALDGTIRAYGCNASPESSLD